MKTVGDKLEAFSVTGVKPGFNHHEENGVSAFETITEKSFPVHYNAVYRCRAGEIAERWLQADDLGMMVQLGFVQMPRPA